MDQAVLRNRRINCSYSHSHQYREANSCKCGRFASSIKKEGKEWLSSSQSIMSPERKEVDWEQRRLRIQPSRDVPDVDCQLAVTRAFGDKSLKVHLSSEDVKRAMIDDDTDFIILASDGLWKVVSNQEAVDGVKSIKNAEAAAKYLTDEAVKRNSKDDISCIVVRFQ